MTEMCRICGIAAGTTLVDDFFPIGPGQQVTDGTVSTVELDEAGTCRYCAAYGRNYDRQRLRDEVMGFVGSVRQDGTPVIVALSGGKDSLCALYVTTALLQLPAIAVTLDNGFIPEPVIAQARGICTALGVRYEVSRAPLYEAFRAEYAPDAQGVWQARTGLDFCRTCSKQINRIVRAAAVAHGSRWAVWGNKTYTRLAPVVSAVSHESFFAEDGTSHALSDINLLFAMGMLPEAQQSLLQAMGWQDPGLPGYTTNCLVPGFVEAARLRRNGADNDAGYLEMELRSGLLTPEQVRDWRSRHDPVDRSAEVTRFFAGLDGDEAAAVD